MPTGAVTFSSMSSLRGLPYPVVCAIGLDDGKFPSADRPTEFDLMAERLKQRKIQPDLLVSSTARRAMETCNHFADTLGCGTGNILKVPALYHAPSLVFYDVIRQLPATANTIGVFAHNPGITDFVNSLCEDVRLDSMPTCGLFAVECPITEWTAFPGAAKSFLFFDYPKA